MAGHNHPSYATLAFLTFQAVIQVVCVCVLGVWAAHARLLNPSLQKHISQLNVQIFTPCLIFVKLASAITGDKLLDLAIIPVLFLLTTGVSFLSGYILGRINGFTRRECNFVIAMAVFGNSNSLPVSLTIALAQTLPALRWLPDDTSANVASRGILYLLIFQQLGQMLRWSWGYNTLLAKDPDAISEPVSSRSSTIMHGDDDANDQTGGISLDSTSDEYVREAAMYISHNATPDDSTESIALSSKPLFPHDYALGSSGADYSESGQGQTMFYRSEAYDSTGSRGGLHLPTFNRSFSNSEAVDRLHRLAQVPAVKMTLKILTKLNSYMNPPLWAMLSGLMVATIRPLQVLIFESPDGFIANTFTAAVTQTSEVAVPLILVVLGGNLYPDDSLAAPSPSFKRIVTASLIARMLLPAVVLLPVLALVAKFVHVSIVDDPIFIVVLFLLTTAPPAIQLSQICQLNEIFEREMSAILFWGYVVLTLPITMVMVVMSLEVLEWGGRLPVAPSA
ncbi:auxin efflux carrier [Myxozyma melibiosi]|uniref:Auxin efflux carrier n=1 Tax=Myxozyma melibiosi TaxID=54550 RepID=A0ABR1F5L2_9ASCO